MDTQTLHPENAEERLIAGALGATYALFFGGALYLAGPVLAWLLALIVIKRWLCPTPHRPSVPVPLPVMLWMAGMGVMLLALIVGHLDFRLGLPQTIKSTVGWAKGWALLALFPLAGCLRVRPEILIRACCRLGLHTLLLAPLFIGAWLAGLPQTLYVSPLKFIGGPGPEFFAVSLYEIDPGSGLPRWRLFTPWAPAIGFVGNLIFFIAMDERHRAWRRAGMAGAVLMILMSGSRLGLLALVFVLGMRVALTLLARPGVPLLGAPAAAALGLAGVPLANAFEQFHTAFRNARADSTRVRETLARIALERWQTEAPVWGHGVVERGPHLVEYMPIGSHHSWLGLLFVKGLVGLLALALPMFASACDLLLRHSRCTTARTALCVLVVLFLYTFGENLEILAYLIWPGLVFIGIAHRLPLGHPVRPPQPPFKPSLPGENHA